MDKSSRELRVKRYVYEVLENYKLSSNASTKVPEVECFPGK